MKHLRNSGCLIPKQQQQQISFSEGINKYFESANYKFFKLCRHYNLWYFRVKAGTPTAVHNF